MLTSIQSLLIVFLFYFCTHRRKEGEGNGGRECYKDLFVEVVFCTFNYLMAGAMTTLCSLEDKSANLYLQIQNHISKNEATLKICPEMFKGH
jgi:hypothetical protein